MLNTQYNDGIWIDDPLHISRLCCLLLRMKIFSNNTKAKGQKKLKDKKNGAKQTKQTTFKN